MVQYLTHALKKKYVLCIIILLGAAGSVALHQHFETKPANIPGANSAKHDNRKKIPLHPLDKQSEFNPHHRESRDSHTSDHPSADNAARLKEFQKIASSRSFATLNRDNNISEDAITNAKLSKKEVIILNKIFGDFHGNLLNLIKNNCAETEMTEENGIKYYNYEISPFLPDSVDRITKLVSGVESTIGKGRGGILLSGYPVGMNYLGSGQYRVTFSLYMGDADYDGWRCKYRFIEPTNGYIRSEGMYNFDSPINNSLAEIFEIK